MPRYDRDFFAGQLAVIEGIVKAVKHEAVIVVTLYSPYMGAIHTVPDATFTAHWQQTRTPSGADGDHHREYVIVRARVHPDRRGRVLSLHPGRRGRRDPAMFEQVIKPYDLAVMEEINARCRLTFCTSAITACPTMISRPFWTIPATS